MIKIRRQKRMCHIVPQLKKKTIKYQDEKKHAKARETLTHLTNIIKSH